MTARSRLVRLFAAIWPPVYLWRIPRKKGKVQARYSKLVRRWLGASNKMKHSAFFLEQADRLYASEIERKATIEEKGSSLLSVIGLALTLTSVGLSITGKELSIAATRDVPIRGAVVVLLLFAIVYFIASGYYALRVVEVGPFWTHTVSSLAQVLSSKGKPNAKWAAERLAHTEINYDLIRAKSNFLSASQGLFLRGLIVLALGAVLLFVPFLLQVIPPTPANQTRINFLSLLA